MTKNVFSICLKKRVKSFQKNVSSSLTNVVSPHVTQVMSWQHLNNGLKLNKVKISLGNSLVNWILLDLKNPLPNSVRDFNIV